MRSKPGIVFIVVGTLIAMGVWYASPALAEWTGTPVTWREAARVVPTLVRPLIGDARVSPITSGEEALPQDDVLVGGGIAVDEDVVVDEHAVVDNDAVTYRDSAAPLVPNVGDALVSWVDEGLPDLARAAVDWARRQAAERMGVAEGDVVVVSVRPVVWRDSSLGCPQSGGMYLQVLTPGYRIELQVGDVMLEYRSSEGQSRAILCETADEPYVDHDPSYR